MEPICERVVLYAKDNKKIPYGRLVRTNSVIDGVEVIMASPSPCYVAYSTKVVWGRRVPYKIKEINKYVLIEYPERKEVYVYPKKVWNIVMNDYIKPLKEGKSPRTSGLLLVGAPGTGKTSLAYIIADILGIPIYDIEPDQIKSKYVGVSERKLRAVLNTALATQPSIILLDDADWLIGKGRSLGGDDNIEDRIYAALHKMLFKFMQDASKNKYKVLIIATTNKKPDMIDPAFRRPGRFGEPITVPLPDLDTIKLLLKYYGIEDEDLAIKLLNAGVSTSKVIDVINAIKEGREPRIEPQNYRGYKRFYVKRVKGFEKIFNEVLDKRIFEFRSRLLILEKFDVGVAIASQLVSCAGKTSIIINDFRYVDEAIYTANLFKSVIIVPSYIDKDLLFYLHVNADVPIIFIGEIAIGLIPMTVLPRINDLARLIGVEPILDAVLAYTGVRVSEEEKRKMLEVLRDYIDKIDVLLKILVSTGYVDDRVIDILT